ncbi:BSD domain-containing protein [Strongyloides ratti]|uniref:BSD domain-containing protein n=1 Tax=Strongyloides ratti TaxID=34506 RepID=A0A090L771_STRRB|nr:BSD domain-containing protein [Strongyloides ratti]CEF63349.1 BSD domain-containing protein [Strongyloides ratti]
MSDLKDNNDKTSLEINKEVENHETIEEENNKNDGNKWIGNSSLWGLSMVNKALNNTMKKTMETFESVKSDFNELSEEFTKQMSSTTEALSKQVENIANIIDNQLGIDEKKEEEEEGVEDEEKEEEEKKSEEPFSLVPQISFGWVSKITDTVKKTLIIEDTTEEEEDFEKEVVVDDNDKFKLDKVHFSPSLEDGKIFLQEKKADEIIAILDQNPVITDKYSRLVPSIMDELGFWMRYYYQIEKIKSNEKILNKKDSSEEDSEVVILPSSETAKVKELVANEGDEAWSMCSSTNNE